MSKKSKTEDITLAKVAQLAGVSLSTVSRILNNSAKVATNKRIAVEKAIAQLDYKPNRLAQMLAKGQSKIIGVLTQDMASPFFGRALAAIEKRLSVHGYTMMTINGRDVPTLEQQALSILLAHQVDGVIIFASTLTPERLSSTLGSTPALLLGYNSNVTLPLFSVPIDNVKGAFMATKHLIDLGHRHIAYVGGPTQSFEARQRLEGYKSALEGHGLAYNPNLAIIGDFREPSGTMAVSHLLDAQQQFSALFCANDQMAFGARLMLHRKGLRVPDDVSLVGFDDIPESMYTVPPLTTVAQPLEGIAEIAVHNLLSLLHPEEAAPVHHSLDLRLTIRESTRRL